MDFQEIYYVYRKAIDAYKTEVGYQDIRKQILTKTLSNGTYVMDMNFETKCRKQDREFFHETWFPKVMEALRTHNVVVGTVTVLPKKRDGEGHYMGIAFVKGVYACLFDPSDAKENSVRVYATKLVKQHLESLLAYWKWRLYEHKTKYTCQILLHDTNRVPIHIDTYCQTWSLLLLIHHWKPGGLGVFSFGKDDYNDLIKRHDLFIQYLREDILPNINKLQLEKTFQQLLTSDGKQYNLSAYDILMGSQWSEYSYLFFRDTPYEVDASGLRISRE